MDRGGGLGWVELGGVRGCLLGGVFDSTELIWCGAFGLYGLCYGV